jgi:hypothetical protein
MYPLRGNGQTGTYIFSQTFQPFGQNATFLPAYTLPYTYTMRQKRELKLYHSRKDSYARTHTHIHSLLYRLILKSYKTNTHKLKLLWRLNLQTENLSVPSVSRQFNILNMKRKTVNFFFLNWWIRLMMEEENFPLNRDIMRKCFLMIYE